MLALMTCTMAVSVPIMMVGGILMAMREDLGLSWLLAVVVPALFLCVGARGVADGAQLPPGAGADRRGQPDPARADHRHPGGARVRARAAGDRALREGQRRPHRGVGPGGPLDGHDVPAGDADRERLQRGRDLVRRPPGRLRADGGRRADRLPQLPDADPDVDHDGHVHADDGAAVVGVRRPDRRGARHPHQRRAADRRRCASCRCTATSTSRASASPTPARSSRCSPTSASACGPARPSR